MKKIREKIYKRKKIQIFIQNKFQMTIFRIHICVTMLHTVDDMADKLIKDVRDAVTELMKDPEKPVEGKVFINSKPTATTTTKISPKPLNMHTM